MGGFLFNWGRRKITRMARLRRSRVESGEGRAAETPPLGKAPVVASPTQPATFPPLTLQGLVYCKKKGSVLINGKTYFAGDTVIGEVLVKSIQPKSVTLELKGGEKTLDLLQ